MRREFGDMECAGDLLDICLSPSAAVRVSAPLDLQSLMSAAWDVTAGPRHLRSPAFLPS